MDIAAVMQELADRLDTITGLTVHAYPVKRVTPPAAIVDYPESIVYDQSMARGSDRIRLPIVVAIGVGVDDQSRDRLAAYADGSGSSSIKAVIESGSYDEFDTVRVRDADFDVYDWNGVSYLTAIFNLDIVGSGS